jgi:hypothetical protein
MHQSILLLLHPLKSFEVNYQYWRALKYLKLFDSLLVHLAPAAKPCVLVRQLLRRHKLPETIIDRHFIILEQVLSLPFLSFIRVSFRELS